MNRRRNTTFSNYPPLVTLACVIGGIALTIINHGPV